MTKDSYRRAFTEAQTELATTIAERDERNARIAQLKQTIRVLGDLLEEDPDQIEQFVSADEGGKPSGITNAARSAFIFGKANNYPLALTVANLKDLMTDRGFDFSGQANALASLTTVVRRLKDSGEVDELTSSDGKRAYVWKGEIPKTFGQRIAEKALRGAAEEMRAAGSEVGDPLSLETPPARSLRPQERISLRHTKGK